VNARLHQSAGDFASMIIIGVWPWRHPATPALVLEQLRGRGQIDLIPEDFPTAHRGKSSTLFARDGSEISAWMPAFGPNPWATSPEQLCAFLMDAGITVRICSGVPAEALRIVGPVYDERPVQDYHPKTREAPRPRPVAPAPADTDQLELFA
jgi:hypothetical protein